MVTEVRVGYDGPARGALILRAMLREQGLEVELPADLVEQRGVAESAVVHAVLHVVDQAQSGLVGAGTLAIGQRVWKVAKDFKTRFPKAGVSVDDERVDT